MEDELALLLDRAMLVELETLTELLDELDELLELELALLLEEQWR